MSSDVESDVKRDVERDVECDVKIGTQRKKNCLLFVGGASCFFFREDADVSILRFHAVLG